MNDQSSLDFKILPMTPGILYSGFMVYLNIFSVEVIQGNFVNFGLISPNSAGIFLQDFRYNWKI